MGKDHQEPDRPSKKGHTHPSMFLGFYECPDQARHGLDNVGTQAVLELRRKNFRNERLQQLRQQHCSTAQRRSHDA